MKQQNRKKGLTAYILGCEPTFLQKAISWLMVLSLCLWPIGCFMAIFFFDAPIRSTVDEISRLGMAFTIWLYPVYMFPLMILWFRVSKHLGAPWLSCLCPLVPLAVFSLFMSIGASEYAERKPEGYDPLTFKRINDEYAIDANHVYISNEILEGADPATFVAPENDSTKSLSHDAHDYYLRKHPLRVADMGSFVQKSRSWAVDSLYVYYFGLKANLDDNKAPISDFSTFRVINDSYAADAKNVYWHNEIVSGADPGSFAVLKGEYEYGQDKFRVYCKAYGSSIRDLNALRHKNMDGGLWDAFHTDGTTTYNPGLLPMPEGTDFATIHRVERSREWFADKKRVYYKNGVLPEANPQTFKVFKAHYVSDGYVSNNNLDTKYSRDGNHVYYRDSLMAGVDIPSFICGYDFVESQSFAFDKNRYYHGNPNPRLEQLRQGKCRIGNQ